MKLYYMLCSSQPKEKEWMWKQGWEIRMGFCASKRTGSIQEKSCTLTLPYPLAMWKQMQVTEKVLKNGRWKSSDDFIFSVQWKSQVPAKGWRAKPVRNIWREGRDQQRKVDWRKRRLVGQKQGCQEQGTDFAQIFLCGCNFLQPLHILFMDNKKRGLKLGHWIWNLIWINKEANAENGEESRPELSIHNYL